jgi:hypothetical protein
MKSQNYANHTRYYPLHHFVITPLTLIIFIWTITKSDFSTSEAMMESIYDLLMVVVLLLLPIIARLYALKLQNRIILNEMRIRYYHLTGKSFEEMENRLKLGQIIALRFASDSELIHLMDLAESEKLSPKEIKLKIKNWKGDYRRV